MNDHAGDASAAAGGPAVRAPLTPAEFQVLLALASGERHGYGIMQEVNDASGGKVRLGPGTLYRTLRNLLGAGLIAESGERPDPTLDDERRRYYRLTGAGRSAAQVEAGRLARLVEQARLRHLLPETEAGQAGGV